VYSASVLVAGYTLAHGVHGEHERGSENRIYKRSQIHSVENVYYLLAELI